LAGSHASELLQIAVRGQLLASARVLILNMQETTAIDREGLESLSGVAGAVRQQGGELRIAGGIGRLTRMGVFTDLAGTVRLFETVEDALGDVRSALERRQSSMWARWSRSRWESPLLRRLFRRV
jgi:anti-anti-sigma regulatory factor